MYTADEIETASAGIRYILEFSVKAANSEAFMGTGGLTTHF